MKYLNFVVILLIGHYANAQRCTILDKNSEFPIQNVQVQNEDFSKMVISDKNGVVDLTIFSELELLNFSHVSYVEFELIKKQVREGNTKIYLQYKSELLSEVFLSATKSKENISRIAEQVAVFSGKQIQNLAPQTSADILANIPGVKVQKTQFGGGSPVLRGMEANRILLVVDGVRMNNAIYRKGHVQNSITVSPFTLDRTEVIFGPSSVIYGSDALGGVIHYYTRKPKISEKTTVNVDFLSRLGTVNNEFTAQAGVELQMKKIATYTSLSRSQFGDLEMGENRNHGFDDWGKQFEYSNNTDMFFNPNSVINTDPSKQRNIGFDQIDFLQKVFLPLNTKTDFSFNVQYSTSSDINRFDRLTETKDGELKFAEWYYGPQNRFLFSTQLNLNLDKKWINTGALTMAYQNIKESRINRKFNSLDRSLTYEKVDVFSLNGDFMAKLTKLKNRDFLYGFEVSYNDVNSTSRGDVLEVDGNKIIGVSENFAVQSRYPDGGSDYLSSAVYLDYRQDINKKSTLHTGIRLTNTGLHAKWIDDTYISLQNNDIYLNNSALTATAGYAYKPDENWQINGVLSSGFRSPNIDDIGKVREKDGDLTVPNPDLEPEFAYNIEAGIVKYFKNKNYYFGLTSYYTMLHNYIIRSPFLLDGSSIAIYDGEEVNVVANVNNETAYIFGGTAIFKGNITERLNATASVTYTKGKAYDTNEPLSSIPPVFGNIEISYIKKKWETGVNFMFNGRKKLEDYNISEGIDNINQTPFLTEKQEYYGSPSWQTLNLYSRYKVTKNIDFLLSANNIFDQHYKEFASAISAPGRNFTCSFLGSF